MYNAKRNENWKWMDERCAGESLPLRFYTNVHEEWYYTIYTQTYTIYIIMCESFEDGWTSDRWRSYNMTTTATIPAKTEIYNILAYLSNMVRANCMFLGQEQQDNFCWRPLWYLIWSYQNHCFFHKKKHQQSFFRHNSLMYIYNIISLCIYFLYVYTTKFIHLLVLFFNMLPAVLLLLLLLLFWKRSKKKTCADFILSIPQYYFELSLFCA